MTCVWMTCCLFGLSQYVIDDDDYMEKSVWQLISHNISQDVSESNDLCNSRCIIYVG